MGKQLLLQGAITEGKLMIECHHCYTGVNKARYREHHVEVIANNRNYQILMGIQKLGDAISCHVKCSTCKRKMSRLLSRESLRSLEKVEWETTTQHMQK
jgi:NifB/MoaA-like Fe-S oxidoreductase